MHAEKMKTLLVEDDMEISEMLKSFLVTENFEVVTAYDGESACDCFFADEYSLVLLDLMIPKRSGMEVMKLIREKSTVPIMILSAKDTDSDKTLGLGLGADELARIKANIRRNTQYTAQTAKEETEASVFRIGQLVLNTEDFTLYKNGQRVEVTAKEFEILLLFMKHPKKVYTKEQLYTLVWKDAYIGDENAVNVHISRLRNKIEDHPRKPQYIVTVWGIGYKLGDAM